MSKEQTWADWNEERRNKAGNKAAPAALSCISCWRDTHETLTLLQPQLTLPLCEQCVKQVRRGRIGEEHLRAWYAEMKDMGLI